MQAITRTESPEEREYARYLGEVEIGRSRVAELQASLELLKQNLNRFNLEYHVLVGTLFVELDKIRLSISEHEFRIARLQAHPELTGEQLDQEARDKFSDQHEEIDQDEDATRGYERSYRSAQQYPQLDKSSEATLKTLFRDLAKRFHPDLARTETERRQNEAVMKRVNAAFHARDVDKLQGLRFETEFEDASFEARSIGEKLIWAIREISRLDDLIETITSENAALQNSELAELWKRHQSGRNVLERLEENLKRQIEKANQTLLRVTDQFQTLTGQNYHA